LNPYPLEILYDAPNAFSDEPKKDIFHRKCTEAVDIEVFMIILSKQ